MPPYVQVVTTTGSRQQADEIAAALVARRLAACVQVAGPITSSYHWKGQIETSSEWQCVAKTREDLYPQVEQAIHLIHDYEVPEILAVPIVAASASYTAWLESELARP